MKRNYTTALALSLVLLFSAGCATKQPDLTRSEVYKKYNSISTLEKNLQSAEHSEVSVFAPEGFAQAKSLFDESFSLAKKNSEAKSLEKAREGLSVLNKAEADAAKSKEVMRDVIARRELAVKAKARELFPDKFAKIETKLEKANSFIESGKVEKAKDLTPELLTAYDAIQIEALEKGVVELAKVSSVTARENDADDYAPKTVAEADKELDLAVSVLKADRTKTDVANQHAKIADLTYKRANRITETLKEFERRDSTQEDIILWYWAQLEEINAPTGTSLDLTEKNYVLVASIRDRVATLDKSLKDSNALNEKLQERITTMQSTHEAEIKKLESSSKMQLSALQKEQAERDRHEKALSERYSFISSLFKPEEATVYREGNNVLISANGFYFPVGKAEIETVNFGLLNKILTSIKQFPESKINISGHTDSTGGEEANLQLSKERADNVAKFLINIGTIDPKRIKAEGYGESKPVASNEVEEGRAKNRRIDLLIIDTKK